MPVTKRYVRALLLMSILLTIAFRYPLTGGQPLGSDTFVTLDLSRSLAEAGEAEWMLTSRSYFGLYPMSYPGGIIFLDASLYMLSGLGWNEIPWIVGMFFSVLLVLGGFVFLRGFGVRADYAAIFSCLMALSPLFLYFTYGQVAARGYMMPVLLLAISQFLLRTTRSNGHYIVFLLLVFGAFTIHRSGYVILLFMAISLIVSLLIPSGTSRKTIIERATYYSLLVVGGIILMGPFLPAVRQLFGDISDISASYNLAEYEYSTGFLFTGDSPASLLGNLAANYVGSIGLVAALFPIGLIVLHPRSGGDSDTRYFILATLLAFTPFVWNAQYAQVILLPFVYAMGSLVLERRRQVTHTIMKPLLRRSHPKIRRPSSLSGGMVFALFVVASLVFSSFVFYNRTGLESPLTGESSNPSCSTVNIGNYLRMSEVADAQAFVSNSGLLDRRVRWYSGWAAPVADPITLLSRGYLDLNASSFVFNPEDEFSPIALLSSIYKPDKLYRLAENSEGYELAYMSWGDIYGVLRLYFIDSSYTLTPRISTNEANISVVIELLELGNLLGPRFASALLPSPFFSEVSSETYIIYEDNEFRAFLAGRPIWS